MKNNHRLFLFLASLCISAYLIAIFAVDPKTQRLKEAVLANDWQQVKQLVQAGADVNVQIPLKEREVANKYFAYYPLAAAALEGNIEMVNYLLEHGSDIHQGGPYGVSVLWVAADKPGNIRVVKVLVEAGAGVDNILNRPDRMSNSTPLDRAADDTIKKYLESKGAEPAPW